MTEAKISIEFLDFTLLKYIFTYFSKNVKHKRKYEHGSQHAT